MATADQLIAWAYGQVGTKETPADSNRQPYAACAGHANGQPWCATFLCCGAKTVGLVLPNWSAYTPTLALGFRDAHGWYATPERGDFVFFDFPDSETRIQHVGLVVKFTAASLTTIEGNTSAGSDTNGGQVQERTRQRNSWIVGYGRPNYTPASGDDMTPEESKQLADNTAAVARIETTLAEVNARQQRQGTDLGLIKAKLGI